MSLFQVANLRLQCPLFYLSFTTYKNEKENNLNNHSYDIKQLHIEYTIYIILRRTKINACNIE